MQVTIKFGLGNQITKTYASGSTVGTILSDRNLLAALGAGDNIQAVIDGEVQSSDSPLSAGDVVILEAKAHKKQ